MPRMPEKADLIRDMLEALQQLNTITRQLLEEPAPWRQTEKVRELVALSRNALQVVMTNAELLERMQRLRRPFDG